MRPNLRSSTLLVAVLAAAIPVAALAADPDPRYDDTGYTGGGTTTTTTTTTTTPPPEEKATLRLTVKVSRARSGRIPVTVRGSLSGSAKVRGTAKVAGRAIRLATRTTRFKAGRAAFVTLRLPARGRDALRAGRRLKLTVTATGTVGGVQRSASVSRTLHP
ncbi:hypothetical protein PAI11_20450 [Patulibacter medicamentivorans]|uniref:Uncharacterized protein n=1 Tax=Patulibacter medicamentivorans TaxID=1097667 RepID=H0E5F4_9ACTN|nr:hypothetical protein [Patulibacter medicamentivorans]EHN11092.1 hypothetical protein PAI11_20450 [Patulibacter medicamentivorans]